MLTVPNNFGRGRRLRRKIQIFQKYCLLSYRHSATALGMPSHGWLLALFIATTHDLTASALSNTTVVSECGYEAGEHRNLFLPPDSTASFRYPTATEAACLSTGVEDRVYSELKKSIEFHDRLASFEDASTVIAAMFNVKQSETIAVINGRIFATKSDIKGVRESSVFFNLPESWRRSRRS